MWLKGTHGSRGVKLKISFTFYLSFWKILWPIEWECTGRGNGRQGDSIEGVAKVIQVRDDDDEFERHSGDIDAICERDLGNNAKM